MLLTDFDFDLPEGLIAQEPLADRAASRMLVVDRRSARGRIGCSATSPPFSTPAIAWC